MAYVYSSLSVDMEFANGAIIKGGAGVANKVSLATPYGVATNIDDKLLEDLKKDSSFIKLVKNGFFTFGKIRNDADDVAKNLNKELKSSQKVVEKK